MPGHPSSGDSSMGYTQAAAAGSRPEPAAPEELVRLLQLQGQQYSNLLSLLNTLNTDADARQTHSQAVLNSVRHQLGHLSRTSELLSRLRTSLGASGIIRSAEVQAEVSRQESLLRTCLQKIAGLEQSFQERKKRLLPQLDEGARRRSMQSAYQQSLRTG